MEPIGIIFDIKQLAVFDGPGIRTTVFMKGCPMRCQWCHNPEGLSPKKQRMVSPNGCLHCGKCREVCPSPDRCIACGACVRVCSLHLRKICGTEYTAKQLAQKLRRDKDYLEANGGGITISGGEPTMQAKFVIELLKELEGMHRAIETCGYCREDVFARVLAHLDFVIMDLKHTDDEIHRRFTGCGNALILRNLEQVKQSGRPFIIRVPVIPGVNDTEENMEATAKLLSGAEHLVRVELLPYHQTAGAKYGMVDMEYQPDFDPTQNPIFYTEIFAKYQVPCVVL